MHTITATFCGIAAYFLVVIVISIGVLAETLEIIWSVRWDVQITLAVTPGCFTMHLRLILRIKILVILETMVAETFRFRSDHLTVLSPLIPPAAIIAVLRFLVVILLERLELLLAHHRSTRRVVVANYLMVLQVCLYVLRILRTHSQTLSHCEN